VPRYSIDLQRLRWRDGDLRFVRAATAIVWGDSPEHATSLALRLPPAETRGRPGPVFCVDPEDVRELPLPVAHPAPACRQGGTEPVEKLAAPVASADVQTGHHQSLRQGTPPTAGFGDRYRQPNARKPGDPFGVGDPKKTEGFEGYLRPLST
jgi:hypothetical protein